MSSWQTTVLRPYQLEGANWLTDLPYGVRGKLLADGLGTGKTATALAAQRLRYERGLMENPCGLTFTTANSAHDWRREAARVWPELKVHLMGSEAVYKRKKETAEEFAIRRNGEWQAMLQSDQPGLIVSSYESAERIDEFITPRDILLDSVTIDECFVGETLVWTEDGPCFIETIKPGDFVYAFNGQKLVLREVTAIQSRLAHNLIEVVFPGHKVKSTANHPYLTMKGWRRAEDLKAGDEVVRVVSPEASVHLNQSLLWESVFRTMALQSPGVEAAVHGRVAGEDSSSSVGPSDQGAEGPGEEVLHTHDPEEPDAHVGHTQGRLGDTQGDGSPTSAGGKREDSPSASRETRGSSGVANGGRGEHGPGGRTPGGAEAGHRERNHQGGRRGGWPLASVAEGSGGGPAEGRLPPGFGVVRVQSVERGGSEKHGKGRVVHNLEVAEAHTYVVGVGGFVVHNCHNLKSANTSRAKLLRTFVARSRQTSLLTGTPVHNRPQDLFNLIDLCHRGAFGSYWKFAEKFFQLHQGARGFGQEVGDLLDKGVLDEAISYLVLGRTAADVMGQMPARQRVLKLVEAPGAERISPAKLHLFKESTGIEAACRGAVKFKLNAAVQLVLDIDKPVVLYTYKREDADKLSKLLTKAKVPNLVATGDSTTAKRDAIIQRWKMGEATALVCTMDAVRESATLVRADVMIFVDLSWLPGTMLQCEGRIDPARQPEKERRPVTYYYLVTKDGPDEVVAESLVHKIEQASGLGTKNQIADSFGEFLSPLDKRVKTEEISPAAMLDDLTARLVARANRFADLGMMEDGGM